MGAAANAFDLPITNLAGHLEGAKVASFKVLDSDDEWGSALLAREHVLVSPAGEHMLMGCVGVTTKDAISAVGWHNPSYGEAN